jgi:hypothetical protein
MNLHPVARRCLSFLAIALVLIAALAPAGATHALALAIFATALICFALVEKAPAPPVEVRVSAAQPSALPVFAPRPPPVQ